MIARWYIVSIDSPQTLGTMRRAPVPGDCLWDGYIRQIDFKLSVVLEV